MISARVLPEVSQREKPRGTRGLETLDREAASKPQGRHPIAVKLSE